MMTAHAITAEMATINRMVNAAMTAIHNKKFKELAVTHQATMTIFSDRRRPTNT